MKWNSPVRTLRNIETSRPRSLKVYRPASSAVMLLMTREQLGSSLNLEALGDLLITPLLTKSKVFIPSLLYNQFDPEHVSEDVVLVLSRTASDPPLKKRDKSPPLTSAAQERKYKLVVEDSDYCLL